jgi:TatD DNase family protein
LTIIDTHTHLYSLEFDVDRDAVMKRAMQQGVSKFYLPAIESGTLQMMLDLEAAYPNVCFAMIGLHPCSVKENFEEELAIVEQQLKARKWCAIGEIGIDLYWDKTTLAIQQEAFKCQVNWAIEYNIPIVIHCREAFDEIYELLTLPEFKTWIDGDAIKGIFHCFSGTLEQANKVIALGFKLGIGGVVTYKNSGLDKVVEAVDLQHLVLETDSPYLTPVPHRGKRNETSYITHVLYKIAEIKKITPAQVADITTQNAEYVFGK